MAPQDGDQQGAPQDGGQRRLPVSRRSALALGGLGALAAVGVGAEVVHRERENRPDPTGAVPSAGIDGKDKCVFADGFDSASTIGHSGDSSAKWFVELPFGWGTTPSSAYSVQDSILRLEPSSDTVNWTLSTLTSSSGISFGRSYFEARLRFPTAGDGGETQDWPAFWGMSAKHVQGNETEHWMEVDFFEAIKAHRYYGTVHDWYSDSSKHQQSQPNYVHTSVDFSRFQQVGCLWEEGRVSWYLNRTKVMQVEFGADQVPSPAGDGQGVGTFSSLDDTAEKLAVVLGTGPDHPMEVDWVAVWQ